MNGPGIGKSVSTKVKKVKYFSRSQKVCLGIENKVFDFIIFIFLLISFVDNNLLGWYHISSRTY